MDICETRPKRSLKIPARFTPVVIIFYSTSIMALLMSTVITMVHSGVNQDFLTQVLSAYSLAMPTAFTCALFVRPLVSRLAMLTIEQSVKDHQA